MSQSPRSECATCYGTGELVAEQGPNTCPHCFGDGKTGGSGTKFEWRLREIERQHRGVGGETEANVQWLLHELRRRQEALVRIVALCQDAPDEPLLRDVKYQANDALNLYEPRPD